MPLSVAFSRQPDQGDGSKSSNDRLPIDLGIFFLHMVSEGFTSFAGSSCCTATRPRMTVLCSILFANRPAVLAGWRNLGFWGFGFRFRV